jgi:hypothetical protein
MQKALLVLVNDEACYCLEPVYFSLFYFLLFVTSLLDSELPITRSVFPLNFLNFSS